MDSLQPTEPVTLQPQKGRTLYGLAIAFGVLTTLSIILRFWSRATLNGKKFSADDWTALAAWPLTIAMMALVALATTNGLGIHVTEVPYVNIEAILKELFAGYIIYNTGITLIRCSAALFYRRVFESSNNRLLHRLVWTLIGLNIAWMITFHFVTIFTCDPVYSYWNRLVPHRCLSNLPSQLGSGITSVILDVVTLLLPLPFLWKLQMKPLKKTMVILVFVAGYSVVIFTIGRLVAIAVAGDNLNQDVTWAFVTPLYWFTCEIGVATISISLPSINNLAIRARTGGFSSLFSSADMSKGTSSVKLKKVSPRSSWRAFNFTNSTSENTVTGDAYSKNAGDLEDGTIHKTISLSTHEHRV